MPASGPKRAKRPKGGPYVGDANGLRPAKNPPKVERVAASKLIGRRVKAEKPARGISAGRLLQSKVLTIFYIQQVQMSSAKVTLC